MKEIVQNGNGVLRDKAKEVPVSDICSEKIQNIIKNMQVAMNSQDDGVAIAAPQIGESLKIFIVSDRVMKEADKEYKSIGRDLVFINPVISKLSRSKHEVEEGCLSVRWKYGKVKRSIKATVKGYNELGEVVERGASGLLAQVFQHETDHLEGVLFIDKAFDVQDIPPEETSSVNNNQRDAK
jgi:peptide deformylase